MKRGRRRRHRLRQYQRGLSEGGEANSRFSTSSRSPTPIRRRRRRAAAEFGIPARAGRRRCSPIRRSRSSSTSPSPRRMSRSGSRRSPPASTSTRRSRSASPSPKRARSSRPPQPRACGSAARRTRSSAARTRPRASASTTALIGRPIGGTAFFMCPGHERWHPNPGFYYLAGGGPMLDMGPYYVTDLVNLLGPVASVSGVATRTRTERLDHERAAGGNAHPGRGRDPCHRDARSSSAARRCR